MILACKTVSTERWPSGVVKNHVQHHSFRKMAGFKEVPPVTVWGCLEWARGTRQLRHTFHVPQVLTRNTGTALLLSSQDCPRDTKRKKLFKVLKDRWFSASITYIIKSIIMVPLLLNISNVQSMYFFHSVYKSCFVMRYKWVQMNWEAAYLSWPPWGCCLWPNITIKVIFPQLSLTVLLYFQSHINSFLGFAVLPCTVLSLDL